MLSEKKKENVKKNSRHQNFKQKCQDDENYEKNEKQQTNKTKIITKNKTGIRKTKMSKQ